MVSVPAHRGQEAFATARRAAGDISPDLGTCLSPTMTNEVIIRPICTTPQGGPGRVLTHEQIITADQRAGDAVANVVAARGG